MKHKSGDKIRRQGFPFTKQFSINRNGKIWNFFIYLYFIETNSDTKHDEYKMQRILHTELKTKRNIDITCTGLGWWVDVTVKQQCKPIESDKQNFEYCVCSVQCMHYTSTMHIIMAHEPEHTIEVKSICSKQTKNNKLVQARPMQ